MNLARVMNREMGSLYISNAEPVVFVVDSDISAHEPLQSLVGRGGWRSEAFSSPREFLARPRATVPNCLVLNTTLPHFNGLDLQKRMSAERACTPVIFITDQPDVYTSVKAMKAGAVEFLVKPFDRNIFLSALREGLSRSCTMLARDAEMHALRSAYARLSHRERQVMTLVVSGLPNKQVGAELGISEITVKAHRGQVMHKMKADSLADLVKIALRLRSERGLSSARSECNVPVPKESSYFPPLRLEHTAGVRPPRTSCELCGKPHSEDQKSLEGSRGPGF
jgi:FixJ family two-component response regulator